MTERCPATTRYSAPYSTASFGVQCKFTKGHDGDHAGHPGVGDTDVFWSDAQRDDAVAGDEDRIREAMTEAQKHPGQFITR